MPNFDYLLYNLFGYTDEEIKGLAQTRISLTLLRDIFLADTRDLLQSFNHAMHHLNELEDHQTGIKYFETVIRYLFSAAKDLSKKDMQEIMHTIKLTFPEGSEIAMTLADRFREEGIEEGIIKGMKKGEANALSKTAIRLLSKRFDSVPGELERDITELDIPALEQFIDDIYDFKTVEDARKYIQ